jgi:membrane AbrB-like protein
MSMSFGADGAGVATVQLIRLLVALAAIDVLLYWLRSRNKSKADLDDQEEDQEEQGYAPAKKTEYKEDLKNFGVAAPWGVLGGALGLISQVPAGGIIGALIGSVVFRLSSGRDVPIEKFRIVVQVLGGTVIGLEISSSFFSELARLAVAGTLIIALQMLIWLATSWLLVKLFRYDLSTSALASSPGGLSGIVPAADEAGADAVIVTFMHLVRLGTIVITVPLLVALIFGF